MDARPLSFTYWSDPLCIWAFVAQPRLDAVLGWYEDRVAVEYRIVPIFGSLPWRFREGSWAKGGVEARVAATQRVARQFGREDVTGEVWRDDTPASSWAPSLAIKAVFGMAADGQITERLAAAYQWRLRERFFVDDVNIARRAAQLAVAEELELPIAAIERRLDDGTALAALWEDHHARTEQKIAGSPTWVFDGGRAKLYGNFDEGVLQATVDQLVNGLDSGGTQC